MPASTCACRRTPSRRHRQATRMWRRQRSPARESPPGEALGGGGAGRPGGRGVDHVIEVGGPGTLTQSITACRTGGHIALIGVLTGFAGEVAIPALFSNQIRISGISIGSRAEDEDRIQAMTGHPLKPVIDRR